MGHTITRIHGRQILDSRGNPTVEVDVVLDGVHRGRAAVPSGASTGSHEAIELRDGGDAWGGKGVSRAVTGIDGEISSTFVGQSISDLRSFDGELMQLDGTIDKGRLGANAILGVSLATARALAAAADLPVWRWLKDAYQLPGEMLLPVPMLNVINGGEHANNGIDVQEFMVVPHGFDTFSSALQAGVRTFHALKKIIDARGMSTAVGDEGGFAPDLARNADALDLLLEAIEAAGYEPGRDIAIAIDVAATEFYADGRYTFDRAKLTSEELFATYDDWCDRAPIVSIEDGASEDDWDGWKSLTDRMGSRIQLVGDDLFVTNPVRLQQGIDVGVANSMLVKVNQIGTLTETIDAMQLATSNGYRNVMSHRSGETEDSIIADLAVGTACGQIKTGAPSRSDRVAKYNQLLRIEEALGDAASYRSPFGAVASSAGRA